MRHVAFDTLIDYLDNRLDPKVHAFVEGHLERCVDCQALLASALFLLEPIDEFHDSAPDRELQSEKTDSGTTPRPALIRRAVAAFRHSQRRKPSADQPAATRLFDSWDSLAMTGIRGHSEERQLLYRFAEIDVDLQITSNTDTSLHTIHGQLLRVRVEPERLEGIAVHLIDLTDGQSKRRAMIDDLGCFNFSLVPASRYTLQIDLDDATVRIEDVQIGPH